MRKGGVTCGLPSNMVINVGLKVLAQAETQMEPNVMDVATTTTLEGPTIPIGVTSPNAKFVTNWVTLPSLVLNSIHRMSPSIVLQPQLEKTKIGCLIQPLPIISLVIFPIYLFIPNMMELTK